MIRRFTEFISWHFEKLPIRGAEVGVYAGNNAITILNNVPNIQILYLIDPYVLYNIFDLPESPDEAKQKAIEQTSNFKEKVKFIYKPFELVDSKDINEPLDFIYIDGDHSYDHVLHDSEKSDSFVKKGVIGGHDYNQNDVRRAVKDFCEKHNYTINFNENYGDPGSLDWWIVKK